MFKKFIAVGVIVTILCTVFSSSVFAETRLDCKDGKQYIFEVVNIMPKKDDGAELKLQHAELITTLSKYGSYSKEEKRSFSTSTEVGYSFASEIITKANLDAKGKAFDVFSWSVKGSLEAEANYKISGSKSNSFSQTIEENVNVKFSEDMANKGYGLLNVWMGVAQVPAKFEVEKYEVKTETYYKNWWAKLWKKKSSREVKGSLVDKYTIEGTRPVKAYIFDDYRKVGLSKKAAESLPIVKQEHLKY